MLHNAVGGGCHIPLKKAFTRYEYVRFNGISVTMEVGVSNFQKK